METKNTVSVSSLEDVRKATQVLEKATLVPLSANHGGAVVPIKRFKGIYNITTGDLCNIACDNYNLVLHKEYIDSFALALNRLNMRFNFRIREGYNKVYADFSFPDKTHKFTKLNEEFMTGIRLINSYNKSTGIGLMPRLTRLACTNGMVLTRDEVMFSVKHTNALAKELQTFIEVRINKIINQYDDLQRWVNDSIGDSVEWRIVTKISEKLFVQINHREEVLKRLHITMVKKQEKKNDKTDYNYVQEEDAHDKITRWEFYNAITEYLTHGQQITPFLEDYYQRKAEQVLITPLKVLAK